MKNDPKTLAGLALLLPAGTVCLSGLLGFAAPPALIHPLLVFGGLLAAMAINLPAVLRVAARLEGGALLGEVRLRVEGRLPNLAIITTSLLLAGVLLSYLFVENFQPR
jgi:hypothetical protein